VRSGQIALGYVSPGDCQLTNFVSFSGLFAYLRSASAFVKFDEKPKHNGLIEFLNGNGLTGLILV
jgi:hypothetical protein